MRKWLVMAVALGVLFMFGSSSWSAPAKVVKGVIANWKEVTARVAPSAYLQLVKIEEQMKGTDDAQGMSAFDSDLPRVTVRPNGSFEVNVKDLAAGKYLIALQRAMPRQVDGTVLTASPPILITQAGEPLIIEVPGTFPLDVGKVNVAVRPEKTPESSK